MCTESWQKERQSLFVLIVVFFFFSSRRRHTRLTCDWSSDVCSSDLSGMVSHSAAKRIFAIMAEKGERPEQIAEREGLTQVGDDTQIAGWVDEIGRASCRERV